MQTGYVTIIAIIAIAGLTALALANGINGILLGSSTTIIGGLGGYQIGKQRGKPSANTAKTPSARRGKKS